MEDALLCPICTTPVSRPVSAPAGGAIGLTCPLCATELVATPDGEVVHEAEWERRSGGATSVSVLPPHEQGDEAATQIDVLHDLPSEADASTLPALPADGEPSRSALDARAFEGSLVDISLPDVLQLLYTSQKTGVLKLTRAEECASITLMQGQIVGCEHPVGGTQIGQTLVELDCITEWDLDTALAEQQRAGSARQPLVATLVALDLIDEASGWKALEKLVEGTVVEVMRWEGGAFVFRVSDVVPADGFRHLAAGVRTSVGLNTQSALMDALRVLDESSRDTGDNAPTADAETDFDLAFNLDAQPTVPIPKELAKELVADSLPAGPGLGPTDLDFDLDEAPLVAPVTARDRRFDAGPVGRLRDRPWLWVGVAAALLLFVIMIALFTGDDRGEQPIVTAAETDPAEPPVAAEAAAAEPAVAAPVGSETNAVNVDEPEAESDPAVEPTTERRPPKKRKRPKQRKAKTKRSLFDAALE